MPSYEHMGVSLAPFLAPTPVLINSALVFSQLGRRSEDNALLSGAVFAGSALLFL